MKTAKFIRRSFNEGGEPGKTIGSNHVLGERRKENFLIKEFIGFWIKDSRDADFLLGLTYSP